VIGATRIGLYFTPISSRLTKEEVDYIVENSGAKVLITSPALADVAGRLARHGFSSSGLLSLFGSKSSARFVGLDHGFCLQADG
jgi:acyl-CoA synthetase (AMP-forming)/AMP-acid ligase II